MRATLNRASSLPATARAQNGELLETIDGVNTPLLKKYIADHLAEGVIEEEDAPPGDGDDEED